MSIISELLDKAHKDSKKGLLKEEQRQYRTALFECLKENAVSDENIYYLVSGLKFGTANTFVNWNRDFSPEKQIENLNLVLDSQKYKAMDNVSRLRMLLLLLIAELNETVLNDYIIGELLHGLVEPSYKKDGSRLSDLGKIFKSCFMSGMKNGMKLPSISKYNYTKEYEIQLVDFFEDAIKFIEPKGDEEIEKRNVLRSWIKCEADKINTGKEPVVEEPDKEVKKEPETTDKIVKAKEDKGKEEITSALGKRLLEMAKAMDAFDSLFRETEDNCKKKEREISRLKTSHDKLEVLYNASVDDNTALRKELAELKGQYEECSRLNKELEERVSRQVSVIDVYDQDKANAKTELLNQIATALKKIYADFKVAETMEMSLDLGENMRDSLDDVFRKLKKLGIDIEGR